MSGERLAISRAFGAQVLTIPRTGSLPVDRRELGSLRPFWQSKRAVVKALAMTSHNRRGPAPEQRDV
jgi:hypothetical protein